MGRSHALAFHKHPKTEIVGLVNRSAVPLPAGLETYPRFRTFEDGLALKPDLVCIATYSDSHAEYAIAAMEAELSRGASLLPRAATFDAVA